LAGNAQADTEVVAHCVDLYAKTNGSTYCCTTCDDIDLRTYCKRFMLGGNFAGIHDQSRTWLNRDVEAHDFVDVTRLSYGSTASMTAAPISPT
jgi:hypothetical protein